MANTSAISRGSLILGVCLPLAVLLGYLLAEPMDSASIGVVVMLLSVLSIPILMRWHHPLLVVSWNACINPFFFPGRPFLWMLVSIVGCFFAVISRATDPNRRLLSAPGVTRSLLCLGAVVIITAFVRGGIAMNIFGTERQGGKGYFFIIIAIMGYFALTAQSVPRERARLYIALYLLSGLTAVISNLAYLGGPKYWFLFELFPADLALAQAWADYSVTGSATRIVGLTVASQAIWLWLFARYGLAGVFDLGRPWRLLLLVGSVFCGLLGGFRSMFITFALVFSMMFLLEKLWRSPRVILPLLFCGVLAIGGLTLFSERLPLSVQRALSFLPVRLDVATRQDAESSTSWRLEIWKRVLPDVPRYFFKGKGYSVDPNDLFLAGESIQRGHATSGEVALIAGDYHNGPLSVVIPFGVYGLVAFGWFLCAAVRATYRNYRYGDPQLKGINRFLLALLATKVVNFLAIYGSLYGELYQFTGLVGLSVCLNGGVARPTKPVPPTP